MTTNRDLLDCLGRTTLVRLSRQRGLAPTRTNDERRKALAYSYHGDVEALIQDLTRTELIEIFRALPFSSNLPPNPEAYRLDDLRVFAIRAFAERPVRIADADATDDDEEEQDEAGDPLKGLSLQWSRPRKISRVLRELGHGVPRRLRTPRFQQLLSDLQGMGVEACLADDPSCSRLTRTAPTPGIAAKLRLRLAAGHVTTADASPSDSARRAPNRGASARKAWETRRARQAGGAGPPIVIQAGERPVSQELPRPSDYNLALLRLQLLTAVPSARRRDMPEWPDAYIVAATRGLELRPPEASLLRAVAAGLCVGTHSPYDYDAIPTLRQVMRPTEWEQLLEDFVALNPFQPEVVNAIAEQIRTFTAERSRPPTWRGDQPTPEDLRDGGPTPPGEGDRPLAAARRGANGGTEGPPTNVRDLGVLEGMFDDH